MTPPYLAVTPQAQQSLGEDATEIAEMCVSRRLPAVYAGPEASSRNAIWSYMCQTPASAGARAVTLAVCLRGVKRVDRPRVRTQSLGILTF